MIELLGCRKAYRGQNGQAPVVAVDGFDLTIKTGEFVCILGPSGCGKTTLLKAVAGLVRLDAGAIRIDGQPVVDPGPDRAMVFPHFEIGRAALRERV